MSEADLAQVAGTIVTHEDYGPGYRRELIKHLNTRTVQEDASFLLPYLTGRSDILDCGCGKGSITLGVARAFGAARVVGCDIDEDVLAEARADAMGAGLKNVTFRTGSIYSLPFEDESFDAIIAHAVFQHLSKPEAAMAEFDRVLCTGGVIGLRDDDRGSMVLAP